METVLVKNYTAPPYDINEIKRYAGGKGSGKDIEDIILSCIAEVENDLFYKVCYAEFPIKVSDNEVTLGLTKLKSNSLANKLKNSTSAIIFGATIGPRIDILINRYGKISPVKALVFQAIGAERIESLINAFIADLTAIYFVNGKTLEKRFSAGYGDLSLSYQQDIFNLLNLSKNIGLTLNESYIMSPSKSVTAIIGVK